MEYEWDKDENETDNIYHRSFVNQEDAQYTQQSFTEDVKTEAPKKKKSKGPLIAILCAIILGVAAGATYYLISTLSKKQPQLENPVVELPTEAEEITNPIADITVPDDSEENKYSLDVSDLVEATMPSLVSITNISVKEVQDIFGMWGFGGSGQPIKKEETSAGTGVIIEQNSEEILIVTNAHVIAGAETLTVSFVDNNASNAVVKGYDESIDIAVIAVNMQDIPAETIQVIKKASFGKSSDIKIGQQVVAIGNALGYGQSVTTGIISAVDRTLSTSSAKLIQTDAAINPGNSGGALFNMQCEIIGINNSKLVDSNVEGMGFAIPSDIVEPLIDTLLNRAQREKVPEDQAAYLGIYHQTLDANTAAMYGLPAGVYITEIVEDSPMEKAGVPAHSVITKFDGVSIMTSEQLVDCMQYYAAGETVDITVMEYKDGAYVEKTYSVTLAHAK
ncbi:MAG: trypsin-like peptidase domain-containing protein [Lachnospiraceae bacterium]|nr:trypsin-like peptidase domain-containing protein [Candidatus Minthocola equi]